MSSTKTRLRELERGKERMEVLFTSLTFDTGGNVANPSSHTATFQCEGIVYEIACRQGEDAGAFTRRAEAEGMGMAQVDHPNAVILSLGAEDL